MTKIAMFTGSFDPITNGHMDIIARASKLFDELDLGVTYLVRGLRNATDFDYEANMDYFNKGLAPEIETVYLIASHEVTPVSSSRVRELIYFEGDISSYVPQAVVKEVEAKRGKQERI